MLNDKESTESTGTTGSSGEPRYHDWREMRRAQRAEARAARWHDPLRGLFWGLLLILIGVLSIPAVTAGLSGQMLAATWLLGLGGVFLIDGVVHYFHPVCCAPGFRLVVGIVLAVIGVLVAFGLSAWWPLVLLGLGILILLRPVLRAV